MVNRLPLKLFTVKTKRYNYAHTKYDILLNVLDMH